jgi:hypothetical protein
MARSVFNPTINVSGGGLSVVAGLEVRPSAATCAGDEVDEGQTDLLLNVQRSSRLE